MGSLLGLRNVRSNRLLTLRERFELLFEPEPMSGCWLWIGNGDRYGQFWVGQNVGAHRAAWLIYRGPLEPHQFVLHRCDVPLCVNPTHLFIGTQLANRQDAVAKGRQARGERIGNSILTPGIVAAMREAWDAGNTPSEIGRRFGVKRVTVNAVVHRRNWAHVP